MCRIAYITNEQIASMPKETMVALFKYLEKAIGGDGNGVGGWVNGQSIVEKGVNMTVERCVELIYASHWDSGVMFHTRKASKGEISDENCHPYLYGKFITCHNGHWNDSDKAKLPLIIAGQLPPKKAITCTDSEIIALLVGTYGLVMTDIIDSGVILTLSQYRANVAVSYGDFECVKVGGSFIYASDLPKSVITPDEGNEALEFGKGNYALEAERVRTFKGELRKVKHYAPMVYYQDWDYGWQKKKKKWGSPKVERFGGDATDGYAIDATGAPGDITESDAKAIAPEILKRLAKHDNHLTVGTVVRIEAERYEKTACGWRFIGMSKKHTEGETVTLKCHYCKETATTTDKQYRNVCKQHADIEQGGWWNNY